MEVIIKGTPEEIQKLLQAIASSKEQFIGDKKTLNTTCRQQIDY